MRRYTTPYTLQKRLKVINLKIKKLHKNSNFFKRNLLKVILFGIGFCLIGPFYSRYDELNISKRESVLEQMDGNYLYAVFLFAAIYISFSILGHITMGIQDRRSLKKLLHEKQHVEEKIKSLERDT
jgi:flagellar biosynthesis protein FlhB